MKQSISTGFSMMSCPVCRVSIPIDISQLLNQEEIKCPHCGLTINIDHRTSQGLSDASKKMQQQCSEKSFEKQSISTGFSMMSCPVCRGSIPVERRKLLNKEEVKCPDCGLTLNVNR